MHTHHARVKQRTEEPNALKHVALYGLTPKSFSKQAHLLQHCRHFWAGYSSDLKATGNGGGLIAQAGLQSETSTPPGTMRYHPTTAQDTKKTRELAKVAEGSTFVRVMF